MSQLLTVHQDDAVLRIGFNRPEKKNALTHAMYQAAADALGHAEESSDVRVVVLHGSETCFTAGNDLDEFADHPPADVDSSVFKFVNHIVHANKPIVAAVAGPAIGIGTTVLLHCDIVVASENTRFQLPFTSLGLCPEAGSSYLLPRLIGLQQASELLLVGKPFDADTALNMGLINNICRQGTVLASAMIWGTELSRLPPEAVRLTKSLLRRGVAQALDETIETESRHFVERLRSAEAAEAFSAFSEKRAPDFSRFD